jgi:hypothetical protein
MRRLSRACCGTTDPSVSHWAGARVSILRSAVLPTTNSTDSGEERKMSTTALISESASELEHLIAELSGSGLQVGSIENLDFALRARAPEMPPNCHQQPTIATSSNLRT